MRYIILILLNLPIILLAFISFVTKYKTNKISKKRFIQQMVFWLIILIVIVASFPLYNVLTGNSPLESSTLSFFDIVQSTAIVVLIYAINTQRQKNDDTEKRLRDLHQEISIKLSK